VKNVAIVISGMGTGGAEISIINLIPKFTEVCKLTLVILQNLPKELVLPKSENLEVIRLNASSLKDFRKLIILRKLLKRYDLIIAHLYWAQIWTGLIRLFSRKSLAKLIWVEQNTYINRTYVEWMTFKIMAKSVSTIYGVSEEVGDYVKNKTNLKTEVLYNSIVVPEDLRALSHPVINSGIVNVAFYGRLVPQKNPFLAVSVFQNFRTDIPNAPEVRFNIIGDGSLGDEMRSQLKGKESVEFFGLLPKDKALKILAKNHIYLSCSDYEGFQLARFEALALGLCVISTKTAGYKFLLNYFGTEEKMRDAGVFFVSADVGEIIYSINLLLNQKYWSNEKILIRKSIAELLSPDKIMSKLFENSNI
jgi:glycosyltransferase involved in cell wall biosynthesis